MRQLFYAAAFIAFLSCSHSTAAEPRERDHARADTGEVLIFNAGTDRLVVAMNTFGGEDQFVDRWFVLQTTVSEPIRVHLPVATVVHSAGLLRVVARSDKTIYEFALGDAQREDAEDASFKVVRATGFGLSVNEGATTIRIDRAPDPSNGGPGNGACEGCASFTQDWDWGEAGGGGTSCTAGGIGSTSCSVTNGSRSCQVTCDSVSYACCKITSTGVSCKCVQ